MLLKKLIQFIIFKVFLDIFNCNEFIHALYELTAIVLIGDNELEKETMVSYKYDTGWFFVTGIPPMNRKFNLDYARCI